MTRWVLAGLLVVGTIVMALSRDGRGEPVADLHADAAYYYVYLPSVLGGDLDFSDEYLETKNWYGLGSTPLGRPANVFGIGPAVFDAPLFAVGHVAALVTGSRGDGFSRWEVWGYSWASLVYTLGAVAIATRLVRRRLGGGIVGPLVAALAGPVLYYAVRQPGYAHPVATFWATLLVERWDASYDRDGPRTLRTWLVLGAVLGAATLARPQLVTWGVLLGAAAVDDLRRAWPRPSWRPLAHHAAGATAAVAVFAPQLVAWRLVYGAWYLVPQGAGFMRWDAPCWSEVLFSSRNGLLPWSPAYAVLLVACVAAARRLPRLVVALIAGLGLQVLVNGAAWDWWAGGSFGGRRFDSTYVVFAFGAAVLVEWARASVRAPWPLRIAAGGVTVVVAVLVAANLWLARWFSVTSVPVDGGVPASHALVRAAIPPFGTVAGWMSGLANLPARAAFAWRHGTDVDAYDRLVGVHVLGETYPGLNSYPDQTAATLPGGTVGPDGRLVRYVGLNRRGGIEITLPGGVTARWNGAPFRGHTRALVRGVNELELAAAPGTVITPLPIRATP